MRPIKDFDKVQASGKRLAPGGYVLKITGVTDVADKEYLEMVFDIAEGPEAGYFKNETPENDYKHSIRVSYKPTAQGLFKRFTLIIDNANGTNITDQIKKGFPEQQLVGKIVGAVLYYEEYETNRGEVKEKLSKLCEFYEPDRIRKSAFNVVETKKLKEDSNKSPVPGFTPYNDDDLPFA